MEIVDAYPAILFLASFLCSLVAGFLFAFAVVVMPGIKELSDREFIRAFQVMDGVIQNNQPLFILVWAGSVVALLLAAALGIGQLDVVGRSVMVAITVGYVFGVQLPTFLINIPLNNRLQSVSVESTNDTALHAAREEFEPRWNRWNVTRTILSSVTSALLIVLLLTL